MIILLGSGKRWTSKLIQWWTNSQWSHVGVYDPETNRVIEARGKYGVTESSLEDFKQRHADIAIRYLPGDTSKVKALVGKGYDSIGIFSFVLRLSKQQRDKWFCSEAIAYGAHNIREDIAHKITPAFISYLKFPVPANKVIIMDRLIKVLA